MPEFTLRASAAEAKREPARQRLDYRTRTGDVVL